MENKIKKIAQEKFEEVRALRHELHMNPELSTEEYETQALVERELDKIGIPHYRLADTGVVGLIETGKPGKTVLLRGDMDALPIQEEVDMDFTSQVDGKMHACGHDGHTAGLLGAAMILWELKDELTGNIKLMFQPAEESTGGAERMIQGGILENPKVDAAFGLHLWGETLENQIEYKHGPMMGAPDEFSFTIQGKGGHASMPHQTIDPVVLLAQAIQSFQTLTSRTVDPFDPVVISVTQLRAGTANNVIPETATASGTIRTLNIETRKEIPERMKAILDGLCVASGATYTFDYMPYYPPVINDYEMTEFVRKSVAKIVGEENVYESENPTLGGEDFAYLGYEVPSSFYYYGIATEEELANKTNPIHHHPKFAWKDEMLEGASSTLAMIAVDYLNEN